VFPNKSTGSISGRGIGGGGGVKTPLKRSITKSSKSISRSPANEPICPNAHGLRRLQQEREHALARYAADRDVAALERTMTRLDRQEHQQRVLPDDRSSWKEVSAVLGDMPAMWREANSADRRHSRSSSSSRLTRSAREP
jgi:hypothetical protein